MKVELARLRYTATGIDPRHLHPVMSTYTREIQTIKENHA